MDLLEHMQEPPINIDLKNAFVGVFDENDDYQGDHGHIVLYDDSEYFDAYERPDVLKLVQTKKMEGIAIDGAALKEVLMCLLESYAALIIPEMTAQDRLKAANRIRDILDPMRLL
tara:strand:- start:468701 stop:469045 length:345 start_codon:yes stop_codon:yes gene_type:complete